MATKRMVPRGDEPTPTTTVPSEKPGTQPPLTEEEIRRAASASQQSTTGLPSDYRPPQRTYRTVFGVARTYNGDQLINLTTGAQRPMYDLASDPNVIIADIRQKEGPGGLNNFLKQLKSRGFYGSASVGNGNTGSDINAVQTFLLYANQEGLERTSALAKAITELPPMFSPGGSGSYQLTNPEDLKAVFQATSQQVIGRGLSQTDLERLVSSYQDLERRAGSRASRGGGYTAPPSVQTYATRQLRDMFSGEAQDFRAMDVADSILGILKGA